MSWQLDPAELLGGGIGVLEYGGVPVVFRLAGTRAMAVDGPRCARDLPHVLVEIAWGGVGARRAFGGVSVSACDARGRALPVFRAIGDTGTSSAAPWIAKGCEQLDAALARLATLDAEYEAAEALCGRAAVYDHPLTRDEYEQACVALDVAPQADDSLHSAELALGEWKFPDFSAEAIVRLRLARQRLRAINRVRMQLLQLPEPAAAPSDRHTADQQC